jgi:hypothetical protein
MGIERHPYPPDTAEELLTCFFTGCEKEFGFLMRKHGFLHAGGLTLFKNGRRILSPFRVPSIVQPPFDATVLYEKDDTAFEISYGGSQYALGLHICYGRVHRFLLREVFEAARRSGAGLDMTRADKVLMLERHLQEAGVAVRKNTGLITAPGEKLMERTLTIHDTRLEQGIRAQHRRETEDAAAQAAKAFTSKDYPRVIALLSPYEEYLNAASLKKLDRARQYLTDI